MEGIPGEQCGLGCETLSHLLLSRGMMMVFALRKEGRTISLQGFGAPEWAKKECGREWRCSGWKEEREGRRGEKKGEKEWERRGGSYGYSKGTQASLKRMWGCPQGVRGHLLPPHCIVHPHRRSGFFLGEALHSVSQFSCLVVSDSLRPYGLQHASLPCPSSTPRACPNSCPSRW